MDKELITNMAKEAGMTAYTTLPAVNAIGNNVPIAWLTKFAALVAESCAKVAEREVAECGQLLEIDMASIESIPAAIRAKFPPVEVV